MTVDGWQELSLTTPMLAKNVFTLWKLLKIGQESC